MIVGVPTEVKKDEYRVAIVPAGVEQLKRDGHTVLIQRGAGVGSGITDEDYQAYGARIVDTAEEVFGEADLICKVKEPLAQEIRLIRKDQVVFTYFHFAASRELTEGFLGTGAVAIAYETIVDRQGRLPLLAP
ncbi:MAG: alanine dehydrogenase, partial [Planctomycetes bacterium]|nr:alanine dehydrogenase [Planctomycetota bacterium]